MPLLVTGTGQRLTSILEDLRRSTNGLVAVGLGDINGLPIAFVGPAGEKEAATAMASLLVSAAERTAEALSLRGIRHLRIDVDGFTILVHPIADRYVLIAILAENEQIDPARLRIHSAADDIEIALEGG